jgi:hypothetical protein
MILGRSVSLVTGYGLHDPRSVPGNDTFSVLQNVGAASTVSPPCRRHVMPTERERERLGVPVNWTAVGDSSPSGGDTRVTFRERCRAETYHIGLPGWGLNVLDLLTP